MDMQYNCSNKLADKIALVTGGTKGAGQILKQITNETTKINC